MGLGRHSNSNFSCSCNWLRQQIWRMSGLLLPVGRHMLMLMLLATAMAQAVVVAAATGGGGGGGVVGDGEEGWVSESMTEEQILAGAFQNVVGVNMTELCKGRGSGRFNDDDDDDCGELGRRLVLPSRNLAGVVDWRKLSKLKRLESIDLSNNSISGHITDDVWLMPSLRELNLAHNQLGGSLIFQWKTRHRDSALRSVNLSFNRLHTFDAALDLAPFNSSLQLLDLSHNRIVGAHILTQLLRLRTLTLLNLSGNNLSIRISDPETLLPAAAPESSSQLQKIDLAYCNLSGSVSALLKALGLGVGGGGGGSSQSRLGYVDVSNNNLSGTFPSQSVSTWVGLQFLNVSFNAFSGGSLTKQLVQKFGAAAFINCGLCNDSLHIPCPPHGGRGEGKGGAATPASAPVPHHHLQHHRQQRNAQHHSHMMSHKVIIALVLAAAVTAAASVFAVAVCWCRRRRRRRRTWSLSSWKRKKKIKGKGLEWSGSVSAAVEMGMESGTLPSWVAEARMAAEGTAAPVVIFEKPLLTLTFGDLLTVTCNFSHESQLAEGPHGPLYRAILPGDMHVTVHVLEAAPGLPRDDAVAGLHALGRMKHPNILPLLGYCIAGRHKLLLIYDFMQNGDLHQWLHELSGVAQAEAEAEAEAEEKEQEQAQAQAGVEAEAEAEANASMIVITGQRLGWATRHRIALGIARALAFLHHASSVHGCLTPRSVVLDERFHPRLADCGIRDLLLRRRAGNDEDETVHVSPRDWGAAYAAADSADDAAAADVYSFGVVAMELVTGQQAAADGALVQWVRHMVKQGEAWRAVDAGLWDGALSEQEQHGMLQTVHMCYLCTAECSAKRPSMQQVVGLLKDIPLPSPSTPTPP